MRKPTLLLLTCSFAYLVLAVISYMAFQNSVNQSYSQYPPNMLPYVDKPRFEQSQSFALLITVAFVLTVIWTLYLAKHKKGVATLLLVLGLIFLTPKASAYIDTTVHVLGVGDEEFDAVYPQGLERYLAWEIYINDCFGHFRDYFGLDFVLTGWISWDSNDEEHERDPMLQEAVSETGYQFQKTSHNGYVIDLLMVFTAQQMWGQAWSNPYWTAMILDHYPNYPRTSFLMHEYTHQSYLEHCAETGICVMGVIGNFGEPMPSDWGPECVNELNTNGYKHRFDRDVSGSAGEGCPFVYVWDGSQYVLDNNILPMSQLGNGSDIEDYYRLEKILALAQGKYRLVISEFEREHSYIDQVTLLGVDHNSDVEIAVTSEGEILTYGDPSPPMSAIDSNGISRLEQIRYIDGNLSDPATFFQGNKNDYLILNFGQVNSRNAKLIVRNDMLCADKCINVEVLDINRGWQPVAVIASRAFWGTEGVNLSAYVIDGKDLMVRLLWTQPHKLDYIGLDISEQDHHETYYANLVSATHSLEGNVKAFLSQNDGLYVELISGQQIHLEFTMPDRSGETRTYIFYAEGHYKTET